MHERGGGGGGEGVHIGVKIAKKLSMYVVFEYLLNTLKFQGKNRK